MGNERNSSAVILYKNLSYSVSTEAKREFWLRCHITASMEPEIYVKSERPLRDIWR
jgi:hypothetical protein